MVAKQWMWKVSHQNGRREINSLHVPIGRPVRLTMISEDVIHSFYVPAFRIKRDVLPGRYSTIWFEPTKAGIYHLFCAEYCGTEHSKMIGEVRAMLDPKSEVRAGYAALMPSYDGKIEPEQVMEITAYLRSIADASGPLAGPGIELSAPRRDGQEQNNSNVEDDPR